MIKLVNYLIQALVIYIFFVLGKLLGLKYGRQFFSLIFSKIAPFFKPEKIIHKNLTTFKKDITEREKKEIISSMWSNYGKTFIEYMFLRTFRENNHFVKIEGEDILKRVKERKKPVIFISGHFANFELMSMEITKKEIPLAAIYRPLNNYFLNPLMEYLRKKYVCKNQIKKGTLGVKEAVQYVKKGFSVALMIDQRVSEGEKIEFFGKPAFTTTLPAQLSIKYGLSIVPVFIERDKENFKIKFYDEIKSSDFNNKIILTKKLSEILELMIARNPNEWIWTHNRWK